MQIKTFSFAGPLYKSKALGDLKVNPGEGKDLLILPDIPAVMQFREIFAGTDSAPFITTFGSLAAAQNAQAERRQVLSRTGRMILMRRCVKDLLADGDRRVKLTRELLALNAELKQNEICPKSLMNIKKGELPGETFAKLRETAQVLEEFENRMEQAAMCDDTDAVTALANAVENGEAREINAKVKRVVAAGFHRLSPSHLRVLIAAQKAGLQAAQVVPEAKNTVFGKTAVQVSSFPFVTNEADFAASEIRKMIDGGRSPGDFAVIVRNPSECGRVIAEALEAGGVAVNLVAGEHLAGRAVSVLIDGFLALAKKFDGEQFARLIRNPMLKRFFGTGSVLEAADRMEAEAANAGAQGADFKQIAGWMPETENFRQTASLITKLKNAVTENLADGITESAVFRSLCKLIDETKTYKNPDTAGSLQHARSLLKEAAFLSEKWDGKVVSQSEFREFASELLGSSFDSRKTAPPAECVPVMGALSARGTSYPVVFVQNCGDGSFPMPRKSGLIFNDWEKNFLNKQLPAPAFVTDAVYLSDERMIWRSVASCAREQLRISFPRSGGPNRKRGISHFASELVQNLSEPPAEQRMPLWPEPAVTKLFANAAKRGFAAEKNRLRTEGDYGSFEGIVGKTDSSLLKGLTVKQVETIGSCAFAFFCLKALGIKEKAKSGETPDVADTGRLYHAALEHIFSSIGSPAECGAEKARKMLRCFLENAETKNRHCKVPDDVWNLQKERTMFMLGRFFDFEIARMKEGNLTPVMFERDVEIEIEGTAIRGRFDRMDVGTEGGAHIVDYKKKAVPGSFCSRENLQVPLYLSQTSKKFGKSAQTGTYVSVERPWEKVSADAQSGQFELASEMAGENIRLAKDGFFAPAPSEKGSNFPYGREIYPEKHKIPCENCAYSDICRIKEGVMRKARQKTD